MAHPWLSTNLQEAFALLKKFQPVKYDPVQLRWWINMMYACAATPGILLVDDLTCELQVTLAAIADA